MRHGVSSRVMNRDTNREWQEHLSTHTELTPSTVPATRSDTKAKFLRRGQERHFNPPAHDAPEYFCLGGAKTRPTGRCFKDDVRVVAPVDRGTLCGLLRALTRATRATTFRCEQRCTKINKENDIHMHRCMYTYIRINAKTSDKSRPKRRETTMEVQMKKLQTIIKIR